MLVPNPSQEVFSHSGRLRVCVLGCTGSVGSSALDVISRNPESFELFAIAAGSNTRKLSEQIVQYRPKYAALAHGDVRQVQTVSGLTLMDGAEAVNELAMHPDVDVVLAAITGVAGLPSTLAALSAGKKVALANKESIVCAGPLLHELLDTHGGSIIPVDSEHSALFQSLQGHCVADISRLTLVATGGPFLQTPVADFATITPEQAVKHPRWSMGKKISVDSATLMNKALEFIEAHFLFAMPIESIEVLVHPQSIIHSLVAYRDGSQMAQLSQPDMRGPIAYALGYPGRRAAHVMEPLHLAEIGRLDFFGLDEAKFPSIRLAKQALSAGGTHPALFNIANEVAVERFLRKDISFNKIFTFVEDALSRYTPVGVESLAMLQDYSARVLRELAEQS